MEKLENGGAYLSHFDAAYNDLAVASSRIRRTQEGVNYIEAKINELRVAAFKRLRSLREVKPANRFPQRCGKLI